MGRKRKDENEIKTTKSLRLPNYLWEHLQKYAKDNNKTLTGSIEHILKIFFKID